jgi:hypothetical protein
MDSNMASVNYPRVKLVVNGSTFIPEIARFHFNGFYHGSKLDATFPIWGNGASFTDQWWIALGSTPANSTADPTPVPILAYSGTANADGSITWSSTPVFDGVLLNTKPSIGTGTVGIACVDRTLLLQQYKLYQAFPNKTGAEIIQYLVSQVGMTADVTGASNLVGPMYTTNHMKLQHGDMSKCSTAWDMIAYIARQTGNIAYVKGTVVVIEPNNPDPTTAFTVVDGSPTIVNGLATFTTESNVISLDFDHNLLMAKDITVEVLYCHSKKGKNACGSAKAGPPRNKNSTAQSNFVLGPFPNMSKDAAQAKANAEYRERTAHEYTATFTKIADFSLSPNQTVLISGAPAFAGQSFYINEIEITVAQEGALMSVTCKTHQQENNTVE